MTREEVIIYVNKVVREEHGMPMKADEDKLIDTGCDSFGITMVLLGLDQKYGVFQDSWIKDNPVESWTLGSIINRVLEHGS